mmetsp:Transcript_155940/g.498322  ORF Transcript_155940/g.498322 Transcript_155940/m.498322 type:complete len:218 (+) Transcript_155940:166-819(+)
MSRCTCKYLPMLFASMCALLTLAKKTSEAARCSYSSAADTRQRSSLVTPSPYVLEHPHPGRGLQPRGALGPGLRRPRKLPRPDGDAFRVWHHREVPAVLAAQTDNALRRAVWIEGVNLRGLALVVDVSQRHALLRPHAIVDGRVGEVALALAVGDPDAHLRALHAVHPHGRCCRFLDTHCDEARLEAATPVVDEAGLLLDGQGVSALGAWHPAEQSE